MNDALTVKAQAQLAKQAAAKLQLANGRQRTDLLLAIADRLLEKESELIAVNADEVTEQAAKGLSDALIDRLTLNSARIIDMANGVRQVATEPDMIGEEMSRYKSLADLLVRQVRVPLGVIGIIYEARPNVTVDAAALCLKTGNAALLRGSRTARQTNKYLVNLLRDVLSEQHLPVDSVQLVSDDRRESVVELARLRGLVDAIVPRGGASLIQTVVESATIPVLETGVGNCHLFVDETADLGMTLAIALNGKCSRPAVCNSLETILVHQNWAERHFNELAQVLDNAGVKLRLCPDLLSMFPTAELATEQDWAAEYLDLLVAIRQVRNLDEAIAHIEHYGSKHSEAIITQDQVNSERFLAEIDAACLYHNASTRFSDGYALGLGAEIGISTQKLHARGPMSTRALTTYKYQILGNGQIR